MCPQNDFGPFSHTAGGRREADLKIAINHGAHLPHSPGEGSSIWRNDLQQWERVVGGAAAEEID